MRGARGRLILEIAAATILATAACASQSAPTAHGTTSSRPSPSPTFSPLASGIYIDGRSGTPHYFVTLTATGTELRGTLAFVYQDGQTGDAKPFTGSLQYGVATLNFKDGSTGTASLASLGFELGECQRWMRWARSRSDCDFHKATAINP